MFDIADLKRAVLTKECVSKEPEKSQRWKLVKVGYLVELFEERAAIIEYDEGQSRDKAESLVLDKLEPRFMVYELVLDK